MSEVSVVYAGDAVTFIGELLLDACLEETHSFSSTITQFPIEDGSVISDHIFNSPTKLSIHGIVSNYPLPHTVNGRRGQYQKVNGATEYSIAQDTLDYLLRIRDGKLLVSVVTSLKQYENMAIKDIKVPRDSKHGGALEFTIDMEQVTVVESATVPATSLSPAQGVSAQAATKVAKGKQSPELTKSQRKSLIIKGLNALGVE